MTPALQEHTPAVVETTRRAMPQFVQADRVQQTALALYRLGLNVFPLERGTKDRSFGQWRRLKTTRLVNPDKSVENLEIFLRLFEGANIALLTGRLSKNLTVLDCENMQIAQAHAVEFAKRGLKTWVQQTARGLHFIWLSDVELANNKDTDGSRGWELRGNSNYILVSGSVHPTGALYEWLEFDGRLPAVIPYACLDWLPVAPNLAPKKARAPFADNPLAGLFKKTVDFCEHGASERTRNDRLFAAACDFASKGWAQNEAESYLMRGAEQSGFDQSFTRRQAARTIASAYNKQRGTVSKARPVPTFERAVRWAESHDWRALCYTDPNGKRITVSAQTLRDVFLACCERQRRDASSVFRATEREIAELARLNKQTARRGLRCLLEHGYLRACGYNDVGARLVALCKKTNAQESPNKNDGTIVLGYSCAFDEIADVFGRGGLGKVAARVWDATRRDAMTTAQIAKRARCSIGAARRALVNLEKHNLAKRLDRRKWISENADPARFAEIAKTLGTLGRSAQRRETHAEDRANFATKMMYRAKFRRDERQRERHAQERAAWVAKHKQGGAR